MIANGSGVGKVITEYIEYKQNSLYYHKKKTDAEKEYNKLLTVYGGESKTFSLEEADTIYKAYLEMINSDALLKTAEEKFNEADEKLKAIGQILFEGNITAEIIMPAINGNAGTGTTKHVTVSFPNGHAVVS
jgi:hypothetical protein